MIRRSAALCAVIACTALLALAQQFWESKPFAGWSKEEVNTILEKSPWASVFNRSIESVGHVRVDASGTEMKYDKLSFRVVFVTAKPVRMALARRAALMDSAAAAKTDWGKYIDQADEKNIMLAMYFSANPAGSNIELVLSQLLMDLKTADLANQTFLSADGKKVTLQQYDAFGENGYGVKFIFPRSLPDGSPVIGANAKEIRFGTVLAIAKDKRLDVLPPTIPISCKWDAKKMTFEGKPMF